MSSRRISSLRGAALALVLTAAADYGAAQQPHPALDLHPGAAPAPAPPPPIAEISPGLAYGYLADAALPDSLALLPPPPAEGSAALAADRESNQAKRALQGSKRWRLAGMDANLSFPWAAGDFACALNALVNPLDTSHLYRLLRRSMTDAIQSARAAKDHYKRPRPFLLNQAPTCTPGAEARLSAEGSYPSEHAAAGWTWALILAEISPEQSEAILARGRAFGESRVVCNAHWPSDVEAGSSLGAAVVARLHADPAFFADVDAAKTELAAVRARKLPPQRDCKFEADAMAQQPAP